MDYDRQIRREIRRVSNFSSLPVLLFTLLQLAVSTAVSLLLRTPVFGNVTVNPDLTILMLYTLIYAGVGAASLVVFYRARSRQTGLKAAQLFCRPKKSAGWCVKWIIISTSFIYLSSLLTNIIISLLNQTGMKINTPDFQFGNTPLGTFAMFLSLSVYAPFFEEMIFRGAVYRHTEIMGQVFAGVFSAVMFGLWHMNVNQLLFATVTGCFSAFLIAKTRSVFPSMILHAGINTLSAGMRLVLSSAAPGVLENNTPLSVLSENKGVLIAAVIFGYIIFGIIIAGIVMFIVSLVKNRGKKVFQVGVFPLGSTKAAGVFLSAPVTLITLAILIIGTVARAVV